ncbi:hypothetical protein [Algibacter lectus]|uniref:hypothetical protein n=1 Tax=Algibacter lectus TaxID=221126 RepID=UPI002494D454|nr:hypothetical protein [Algibacter lectus]
MENIIETLGGELLSYGVSGFALIMISLTYYLMRSELKREEPRSIALKTIWGFMILVLISTVTVGFFSLPVASENDKLSSEVNELTSDMSHLIGMVTDYEYTINKLVDILVKNGIEGDEKPPVRPNPRFDGSISNYEALSKYVDISKIQPIRAYKIEEVNDSISKEVKKEVNNKLKLKNRKLQSINQ